MITKKYIQVRGRQYGINRVSSATCSRLPSNRTESRTCYRDPKGMCTAVQISRFGVIPKASQPGKWRLILDLSSPDGSSVNDGIDAEHCSIDFATVDMAMRKITELGRGTQLVKVDIEHAYHNVPVHPDDRPMLGMMWGERVYVDTVLPFGLRSAPKIFSSLSDCLEWIIIRKGVSGVMHYLDHFFDNGQGRHR